MLTTVIRRDQQYQGTDELSVEFYSCHECGFERVPHVQVYMKEHWPDIHEGVITAKYCPGCGRQVEWV